MRQAIVIYLPYVLSALTIYSALAAGNKRRIAWSVGLANQGLWFLWIWASRSWGLAIMTVVLTAIFARNWIKWGRA